MRTKVDEVVSQFIEELRGRHPGVTVELLDWETPHVDAWLRIKASPDDELDLADTVAHLTTKYYLDEGVYIQTSESYSGPLR